MKDDLSSATTKGSFFKAILIGGFIVGAVDAIAASVAAYIPKGIMPDAVFRYVASGVLGKEAFAGGSGTAWLGLFFHFTIAYGWTVLFFVAYPRIKFFTRDKTLVGMVYGVFVLLMMNLVVVPLSNVPNASPGTVAVNQLLIHMFLIGLPISLLSDRYYANKKS